MLPKKKRLNTKEFDRFFSLGRRFHFPSLTIIYAPYESLKVSAVAPKKVAPTAVLRNKLRRRIYNACARLEREKAYTGVYICVGKKEALTLSYKALEVELSTLIRKIGAMR